MSIKRKEIIFTMRTKDGSRVSGKKTKDCHYYLWDNNKFVRCKKSDISVAKCFNF